MLPMFRRADDVARFVALVAGRAGVVGLLETREAVADVEAVARCRPRRDARRDQRPRARARAAQPLRVLVSPAAERDRARRGGAGLRLGVGGIGRLADAGLPIAPDLVYAQYPRLGATAALVSRSFLAGGCDLAAEVPALARAARVVGGPPARGARRRGARLAAALARARRSERAGRASTGSSRGPVVVHGEGTPARSIASMRNQSLGRRTPAAAGALEEAQARVHQRTLGREPALLRRAAADRLVAAVGPVVDEAPVGDLDPPLARQRQPELDGARP